MTTTLGQTCPQVRQEREHCWHYWIPRNESTKGICCWCGSPDAPFEAHATLQRHGPYGRHA